jgi:hypothetical protein
MPEPHPGVATIDAFMNAEKRLLGADGPLLWGPGRNINERVLRLPIEVNGELLGQSLAIIGFPRERRLKFRVVIIFRRLFAALIMRTTNGIRIRSPNRSITFRRSSAGRITIPGAPTAGSSRRRRRRSDYAMRSLFRRPDVHSMRCCAGSVMIRESSCRRTTRLSCRDGKRFYEPRTKHFGRHSSPRF